MVVQQNLKRWRPKWPLTGNGYFYGRIGSGKSFKLKTFCEYYYEKRCKIWDWFGGKRGEGPFWAFPSDEIKLWRDYEQHVGIMDVYGPKEYPVNLVYPFFLDDLPNELPEKKPRVSCKVMTIYFKDITIQDISLVIGGVSQQAKYVWNYICRNLSDNANGQDILNLLNTKKFKRYQELTLYKSFILPLCNQKILVGKKNPNNIDLIAESKKRDEIFVLCDDFVPKEFRLFIMGHLLRRLFFDIIMQDKTHKLNIALFREMSLFMKVVDASGQDAEQIQNFRNLITDIARYARSGLFIFGDTQSPREVAGMIEGSDDITCLSEMPSPGDRMAACEALRKDRRISSAQIAYLSTMPVWEAVVIERGAKAKLVRRVQPPRSKSWKQNDVNFMSAWKKAYNSYTSTVQIKSDIQQMYEDANEEAIDENVPGFEDTSTEDEQEAELENSDNFESIVKENLIITKADKPVMSTTEKEDIAMDLVDNEPEKIQHIETGKLNAVDKDKFKNDSNINNKPKMTKREKQRLQDEELTDKVGDFF